MGKIILAGIAALVVSVGAVVGIQSWQDEGTDATGEKGIGTGAFSQLMALTADWNQTGPFDIVLNNASSELKILESSGATFHGLFDVADLSDDRAYVFPDASGTVALLDSGQAFTSATWQGAVINSAYGGTGLDTSNSTGVATVSDGEWSVAPSLSVSLGGTSQTNYAKGDILYASASDTLSKLKIGKSDDCLKVTKGVPVWDVCDEDEDEDNSGGGDLQTSYETDDNGSDVTVSLTATDDSLVFANPASAGTDSAFLLQLSQANTTASVVALDIVQSSSGANGMNITANSIDTETGLSIAANGLTAGGALAVTSTATSFTGNLAGITLSGSAAGNTGNVFAVSNTGTANGNTSLFVDHRATGTNNLAVRVNDEASDATPFVIDGSGSVGVGTLTPSRVMDIFQAASAPQLRLSKDLTNYSEFTVNSTGDLLVGATGSDIRALSENLWVCDNDACPALTLTGDGNIFVENVLKFGNGVYMKNDSATELGVYDNDDNAMIVFDEQL